MIVRVECLNGTKEKYELVKTPEGDTALVLDRMLERPWIANYGSIPETLQADGDELDAYILGDNLCIGESYDATPLCIIYSVDNGVVDNKLVLVVNSTHNIRRKVKQIIRYIGSYKAGSKVLGVSWKDSSIIYEVAKCKAYDNIFKGGKC